MNTLDFLAAMGIERDKFYEQACRGMFQAVDGIPGQTEAGFEPTFELSFANSNTEHHVSHCQILCNGTRSFALKYFGSVAETNDDETAADDSNYALTEGKALVSPEELLEAARALGLRFMNECPEPVKSVELRLHGGESRSGVGRYLNLTELSLFLTRNTDGTISDHSTSWRKPEDAGREVGAVALVKGAAKGMDDFLALLSGERSETAPPSLDDFTPPANNIAEAASRLSNLGFRVYKSDMHVQFYGYPKQFNSIFGIDVENKNCDEIPVPESLADVISAIGLQ